MTVLVDGREFALFAADQLEVWSNLESANLRHTTFGRGTICKVTQRRGYIPLISVAFESQPGVVRFNTDGFKAGEFFDLELPIRLQSYFERWKEESVALGKRKEQVSVLAEKYNVDIEQFADSTFDEVTRILSLLVKAGGFRWPHPLKVRGLEELDAIVGINANAAELFGRFQQFGMPWDLVNACSQLRKIGNPDCARD